jgi:hypothetical protein
MSENLENRPQVQSHAMVEKLRAALETEPQVRSQEPVEELLEIMERAPTSNLEVFDTGAFREKTNYRYDLLPASMVKKLLNRQVNAYKAQSVAETLRIGDTSIILSSLSEFLDVFVCDLAHPYAQAMHEIAEQYGERYWEKGIPESNLINNALYHLFRLVSGDKSENHRAHLVWNVLTLVHFRESQSIDRRV